MTTLVVKMCVAVLRVNRQEVTHARKRSGQQPRPARGPACASLRRSGTVAETHAQICHVRNRPE